MDKRKVIVLIFVLLIILTIAATIAIAIISFNDTRALEDQDLQKWAGVGVVIAFWIGLCFVFYELDLLCTVHCVLVKPKPIIKTVLCILANLCLTLNYVIFFYKLWGGASAGSLFGSADKIVSMTTFYMYWPLRIGFFIAAGLTRAKAEKPQEETK